VEPSFHRVAARGDIGQVAVEDHVAETERLAARNEPDRIELPAADERVGPAMAHVQILSAFTKWQFVNPAERDLVRSVESRNGLGRRGIPRVLELRRV